MTWLLSRLRRRRDKLLPTRNGWIPGHKPRGIFGPLQE